MSHNLPWLTRTFKRIAGNERGSVAILAALSSLLLIGVAGLAIDVSMSELTQRCMQDVADEASKAATIAVMAGNNPTPVATAVAASNGFVNGRNGVSVTVNWPPSSGSYQGNGQAVEVIITEPAPVFFSRLVAS